MGFVPFLLFLGFLSLNLAVLNFLPIPVLDGGHMVFLLWEGITGKRPSEKIMVGSLYVGLAFLLGLMALVLYLDIGRLFTTPK
jgi:regulator of sigma E protease